MIPSVPVAGPSKICTESSSPMTRETPSLGQSNRACVGMHSMVASQEPFDAIVRALHRLESRAAETRMMIVADQRQLGQIERDILVLQNKLKMQKSVVDEFGRID